MFLCSRGGSEVVKQSAQSMSSCGEEDFAVDTDYFLLIPPFSITIMKKFHIYLPVLLLPGNDKIII